MTRPLRQRHRSMICVLGVILPFLFVAGLGARKPVPVVAAVSKEITGEARPASRLVWTKSDLWPGQPIITWLFRDAAGNVAVNLMAKDLVKPDVLVYWASGSGPIAGGLPDNARLLGAWLDSAPLFIPAGTGDESGRLILFSLADREIVATSSPFHPAKD